MRILVLRAAALGAVALMASLAYAVPLPQHDATAPEADTLRVLDVPFVAQSEALCGGAAAAMVLRYWGARGIYAEDFAPLVTPSASGIRTGDLVAALDSLGWQALPFRGSANAVERHLDAGRPVVALLEDRPGRFHYVVLVARTDQGALFHDPAIGPHRFLDAAHLDRAWRPSGYWALLVLPEDETTATRLPDEASPYASPAKPPPGMCTDRIAQAVEHARQDAFGEAERLLRDAAARCPDDPAVPREQAGLRFRQQRWTEAAALAEHALSLDATNAYTWRLLASSRYLAGDREEALRAWNRVDEPHVDLVEITGLERTRYAVVADLVNLEAGALLTPSRLARARRRLTLLPTAASTTIHYDPVAGGDATVNVTVFERPLLLGGWLDVGALAVEAVARHTVALSLTGWTGNGERLTMTWRWRAGRPRVALRLATPPPGLPGILIGEGFWERQSYRTASASTTIRETQRHGGLRLIDWATDRLRWTAGGALDRWNDRGLHVGAEGQFTYRLGRRWQVHGAAAGWMPLDKAFHAFVTAQGTLRWHADEPQNTFGWTLHAGLEATSAQAPLALWRGAGTGQGREPLLRAHPLLDAGVITGRVFGRILTIGGIEARHWLERVGPFRVGPAAFVDAATAWETLDPTTSGHLHVDTGIGVRVGLPGTLGRLRLDVAYGLRDGATALSAGWDQPLR